MSNGKSGDLVGNAFIFGPGVPGSIQSLCISFSSDPHRDVK